MAPTPAIYTLSYLNSKGTNIRIPLFGQELIEEAQELAMKYLAKEDEEVSSIKLLWTIEEQELTASSYEDDEWTDEE